MMSAPRLRRVRPGGGSAPGSASLPATGAAGGRGRISTAPAGDGRAAHRADGHPRGGAGFLSTNWYWSIRLHSTHSRLKVRQAARVVLIDETPARTHPAPLRQGAVGYAPIAASRYAGSIIRPCQRAPITQLRRGT